MKRRNTIPAITLATLIWMALCRGADQAAEDSAEVAFKTAATLMQKGQHKEAIPFLKRVHKEFPDDPNVLWNLGIALSEVGDGPEALDAWRSYHKLLPEDWQARPKLIQSYQAVQDLRARDDEIKSLYEYRKTASDQKLKTATRFCREQCSMAGQRVFAFEYFSPEGPRPVYFRFSVLNPQGEEQYYLSLGSYEDTTSIARELGEIGNHERLYHLDEYRKGQHKTFTFFKEKPSYDQVRTNVVLVLENKIKPVSSSSKSSANEK